MKDRRGQKMCQLCRLRGEGRGRYYFSHSVIWQRGVEGLSAARALYSRFIFSFTFYYLIFAPIPAFPLCPPSVIFSFYFLSLSSRSLDPRPSTQANTLPPRSYPSRVNLLPQHYRPSSLSNSREHRHRVAEEPTRRDAASQRSGRVARTSFPPPPPSPTRNRYGNRGNHGNGR